jgi:hypothetical protein
MRIDELLSQLLRSTPKSPASEKVRRQAEAALRQAVKAEGLAGVQRLVKGLNGRGHRFSPLKHWTNYRGWREELADGEQVLELHIAANSSYTSASVRYFRRPRPTARQRATQELQKRFYDRYVRIGQKAYRDPRLSLSPTDRRLLRVGELEADVNNGGFSQYLANKGARRARSALAALKTIGARKTAAMLEAAMAKGVTPARLSELDGRFYKAPEDLAVLAARHARLSESKA